MNRSRFVALGVATAVICLVVATLYWVGVMPPDRTVHVKHGILFLGLALVATVFALANRTQRT